MAEFGNMLASDEDNEDSNEDIDHIPKTPGPALMSDREESDEEKSVTEEKDEEEVEEKDEDEVEEKDEDEVEEKDEEEVEDEVEDEVKNTANNSESDSDSSDSESISSNDNNRNSQNDSEVERSDNENDNRLAIDDQSSDENVDKSDNEEKVVNESHDNDSENEDVIRHRVKNKRKFDSRDDSSSDESNQSKSETIDKKPKLDTSDNEENEEEMDTKNAKAKDIFGDMSSEDEDDDNERQTGGVNEDEGRHSDKDSIVEQFEENSNEGIANNNETVGEQSFIEDEEPQEEPVPETRIEVEIPRIVADLGKEIHFVKLPNFLSIDTHPYDPQWYEDEIDEDEIQDDEGRARLKLKVENTIRWRNVYDKETGDVKRESNARTVRWSDGSLSLHLGDEIFDIHKLHLMPGDNNHLFIRQGTGLQGQTVFRTKLTFRPFSTESFTHRKLTLSLADRSQKTQKIRVLPNVGKDPEAHRSEMIKKEEDRLKASIRRENKQRKVRERSLIRGPTASYLEPDGDEDDEEEGISISKIKNQFKRNPSYSKYPDEESGEESKPANDDDDSEPDIFDKKTDGKKKSVQIIESDDDE